MAIFIELLLIGVGLSMDAFAVSICKGLAMRRVNKKQAFVIGLFFGGFQALCPEVCRRRRERGFYGFGN